MASQNEALDEVARALMGVTFPLTRMTLPHSYIGPTPMTT